MYYDENTLNINAAHEFEGLASCLDYFRAINDPFSAKLQAEYDKLLPGHRALHRGQRGHRHVSRPQALGDRGQPRPRRSTARAWRRPWIARASSRGPGGPAEMVPGKRHCKMNMYIAVAKNGNYEVVSQSKGLVDPKEC